MKKKFLLTGALALLIGSSVSFAYHNHVKAQEIEAKERLENKYINNARSSINELYSNIDNKILSETITQEEIVAADKAISKVEDKFKKTKFNKELQDIQLMFDANKLTNALLSNQILIDDVTLDVLNSAKQALDDIKYISNDYFVQLKSVYDEAELQYQGIVDARGKVTTAQTDINRNSYETAVSSVSLIKNTKEKDTLTKSLVSINAQIVAMEQEKAKLEAEKAIQTASSNAQNTNQTNASNSISTNSTAGKTSNANSSVNKNTSTVSSSSSNTSASGTTNNKASSQNPPATNDSYMDGVNSAIDAINNGNYSHIGSGNNGSGNNWDEFEIGQ